MKEGQLPDDQGVEWGFAEYVQRGSSLALRREVSFMLPIQCVVGLRYLHCRQNIASQYSRD